MTRALTVAPSLKWLSATWSTIWKSAAFFILWATLISSLNFMLYHAAGFRGAWLPAFNVFRSGILFALAYQVTGNLWLPVAIHFVWNFLLGPVAGLAVSGQDLANSWHIFAVQGPALFTGGAFGIEGGLVVTLVTLLGIAILALFFRSRAGE
jgi:hypothetical protein